MILSDRDIKKALSSGRIKISPKPDLSKQLGSCLLDLRLGDTFRVYNHNAVSVIDSLDKKIVDRITTIIKVQKGKTFVLHPDEFVLAATKEFIEMPEDLTGRLEGRSSIGRLGVIVHSTSANIECGFRGKIVLELANIGRIPVKLHPDMRICAVAFEELTSSAETPYYKKKGAKYIGQKTP